jgi:hypothetical protein
LEVIILDNASTDGSVDLIKNNFSKIVVVENKENIGHSDACNQGAKIAKGEYLLFIDNDTNMDRYFVKELLKVFDAKPDAGVAGGIVKDYGTNYIQELGILVDYFGYALPHIPTTTVGYLQEDKNQFTKILETFYVSSCALMIPKWLFFKVGGFDRKYFVYKDDLDLCWRVQLVGYRVYVNPKAKIYHKMGVTLGGSSSSIVKKKSYPITVKKRYFGERNTIRTLLKNYELKVLMIILPIYILINLVEMFFFVIKSPKILKSYLEAWIWDMKEINSTLEERKKIQKIRKVSDLEILRKMYKGIGKLRAYRLLKNVVVS